MKKLLSVLFIMVFVLTLASCGGSKPNTNKIYISYSSWGDAEFEQKMIDKFMVKYPNIEVYLDKTITGTGGEFTNNLVIAAQAGTVPDVFAIDNVPVAISNALTLDIAEYWNNDPDTQKVYPNIAETGKYGEVRYAAPSYQFIRGVYINKTILDDAGLNMPDYDWTYQEMIELARQFTNPDEYMYGINGGLNFDAVVPSLDNAEYGYHTWDGQQFHFTSQAWIDAFKLNRTLVQEGVVEQMTAEEKEALFGASNAWPFIEGHTLMGIDGSWNVPYVKSQFDAKGYELIFMPYPGGSEGQRIPVVLDYMVVSSKTEHPYEAYLLMKWMSFGEEGWKARLEIMEEMGTPVTAFPVAEYPEVWTKVLELSEGIPGMKENAELIKDGVPDTDKWLPGYNDFWAWHASDENPYMEQWATLTPEQIAPIYEEYMNRFINEAYAKLNLQK